MGWMPALDGEPAAGEGGSKGTRALRPEDLEQLRVLDREATGEDRSSFLRAAADQGGVAIDGEEGELDGFDLYCRWGPGPTVARTPEAGLELIETRRRRWRGPRAIILPTSNDAVLAGLPEARWFMRLTRMRCRPCQFDNPAYASLRPIRRAARVACPQCGAEAPPSFHFSNSASRRPDR